jgi:hypothetical protein
MSLWHQQPPNCTKTHPPLCFSSHTNKVQFSIHLIQYFHWASFLFHLKEVKYSVLGLNNSQKSLSWWYQQPASCTRNHWRGDISSHPTVPEITVVVTSAATQLYQKSPPKLRPVLFVISYYANSSSNIILLTTSLYKDMSCICATQLKFVSISQVCACYKPRSILSP